MSDAGAIRAGRAFVEIFTDSSKLDRELSKTEKRFKMWGQTISAIGLKAFAGGAALAAPLLGAAKAFGEMGAEMARGAQIAGTSVEQLSALKYAAEQSGVGLEALQKGLGKMSRSMVDAAQGDQKAIQAFRLLGLTVGGLAKMSPEKKLAAVAEALAKIKSPDLRRGLVEQIFGRAGGELLPLFAQGSAGIGALTARAKQLGLVMSGDDARAGLQFSQTLGDLWSVVKMGVFQVGGALAPALTIVANKLSAGAQVVTKFVQAHRGIVLAALGGAAGLMAFGGALTVAGYALKAMAPTIGVLRVGLSAISGVAGIASGAIGAVFSVLGGGLSIVASLPGMIIGAFASMASFILGLPAMIAGAFAAIGTGLAVVFSPLGILTIGLMAVAAAVVGIGGYFLVSSGMAGRALSAMGSAAGRVAGFLGSAFQSVKSYLSGVWTTLKSDALAAFGGIRDALSAGDWSTAAKICWTLIRLEWARGTAAIRGLWLGTKGFLLSTWYDLSADLTKAWSLFMEYCTSWDGIRAAASKFCAWLSNTWSNLIDYLSDKMANFLVRHNATAAVAAKWGGRTLTDADANELARPEVARQSNAANAQVNSEANAQGLTGKARADWVDQRKAQLFGPDQVKQIVAAYIKKYSGRQLSADELQQMADNKAAEGQATLNSGRSSRDAQKQAEYSARQQAIDANFAKAHPDLANKGEAERRQADAERDQKRLALEKQIAAEKAKGDKASAELLAQLQRQQAQLIATAHTEAARPPAAPAYTAPTFDPDDAQAGLNHMKLGAVGTFNGGVAGQLVGGGKHEAQIAQHTKATAEQLKEVIRVLRGGGLGNAGIPVT